MPCAYWPSPLPQEMVPEAAAVGPARCATTDVRFWLGDDVTWCPMRCGGILNGFSDDVNLTGSILGINRRLAPCSNGDAGPTPCYHALILHVLPRPALPLYAYELGHGRWPGILRDRDPIPHNRWPWTGAPLIGGSPALSRPLVVLPGDHTSPVIVLPPCESTWRCSSSSLGLRSWLNWHHANAHSSRPVCYGPALRR